MCGLRLRAARRRLFRWGRGDGLLSLWKERISEQAKESGEGGMGGMRKGGEKTYRNQE